MEVVMGVDVGTTSTKAVLFSPDGQVLGKCQQGYPLSHEEPQAAEQDPQIVLAAIVKVIHDSMAQLPSNQRVVAVSFSVAMHSLMLLDEQYQPLTKIITWADNRAAVASQQLAQEHEALPLYQRTGVPVHPMTPLVKLKWLHDARPHLIAQARYVSDIKSYVFRELFGEFVLDKALAGASGLWNWHTQQWDQAALQVAHVTRDQLPTLHEPAWSTSHVQPQWRERLGLKQPVRFYLGASDGALSNIGMAALSPDTMALTIGTSGAVRVTAPKPHLDPAGRLFCYYLAPKQWVIGGPVNNGGIVVQWLAQLLGTTHTPLSYEEVLTLAAASVPGAHGLLCHPYLAGERAPLWQAEASGSFVGLTMEHTRADIARAVLEGIVFNLERVRQIMTQAVGPSTHLCITGGVVQSAFWRQLLADCFGQTITVPHAYESSCLGAAAIAWADQGYITDFTELASLVGATYQVAPQPQAQQTYRELWPLWLRTQQQLQADYHDLASFRAHH